MEFQNLKKKLQKTHIPFLSNNNKGLIMKKRFCVVTRLQTPNISMHRRITSNLPSVLEIWRLIRTPLNHELLVHNFYPS